MYSATPTRRLYSLYPGSNEELTVKLYKEELGKPYSKVDLFLCNVSSVEGDAVMQVIAKSLKTKK